MTSEEYIKLKNNSYICNQITHLSIGFCGKKIDR